jgi:hypothetical protein
MAVANLVQWEIDDDDVHARVGMPDGKRGSSPLASWTPSLVSPKTSRISGTRRLRRCSRTKMRATASTLARRRRLSEALVVAAKEAQTRRAARELFDVFEALALHRRQLKQLSPAEEGQIHTALRLRASKPDASYAGCCECR